MTEQDVDEITARLDYLEAAMDIERTNGYMPYAEFVRTLPDGLPPEVVELADAGQRVKATMQLSKLTGISPAFAQVVLRFRELREGRAQSPAARAKFVWGLRRERASGPETWGHLRARRDPHPLRARGRVADRHPEQRRERGDAAVRGMARADPGFS
jgi:hypothetical protein